MPLRYRSGLRSRVGTMLATMPQFLAVGAGAASNPSYTGPLIADLPQFVAAGSGLFQPPASSGRGYRDYYDEDPDRFIAGDATGSGNGLTESTPWTWSQMLANATAGMVVGALPGTFTRAGSDKFTPSFNCPSGVTIVCKRAAAYNTDGRTQWRNGVTTGDNGGATIGGSGRSDFKWIGAYVDENVSRSASDAGPVVFFNGVNAQFHGLLITCVPIDRVDNHNAFRAEQVYNWLLKNSILENCRSSRAVGDQNFGAVMTYDALGGIVEHCWLRNNDVHLVPKGDHGDGIEPANGGFITRYCLFTDALGMWMHLIGNNSVPGLAPSRHHNNLIIGAPTGVYLHSVNPSGHPYDNLFEQNTFVDVGKVMYWGWGSGALPYAHNIQIARNLMVTATRVHDFVELGNSDLARVIANGCSSNENHVHAVTQFANMGGAAQTLAQWRSLTQAQGGQWEGSTTTGDPLFVAPGSGNYRLQAGSPAAGMGCYQTGTEQIGLEQ